MESNWRFNVWDQGWQDGPYNAIARIVGAPFGLWIARKEIYDGTYDLLVSVGPGQPLAFTSSVAIPPTAPHFPHGVAVIAD